VLRPISETGTSRIQVKRYSTLADLFSVVWYERRKSVLRGLITAEIWRGTFEKTRCHILGALKTDLSDDSLELSCI